MNPKAPKEPLTTSFLLWNPRRAEVLSCSVMSDSCDPMNCSLPGSSLHETLQVGILEWVAISFSKTNKTRS